MVNKAQVKPDPQPPGQRPEQLQAQRQRKVAEAVAESYLEDYRQARSPEAQQEFCRSLNLVLELYGLDAPQVGPEDLHNRSPLVGLLLEAPAVQRLAAAEPEADKLDPEEARHLLYQYRLNDPPGHDQ